MAPLPEPPVPLDADLRDFEWMAVDVKRLRDSTLATKSAEVFRAAVLSWCVAWHQLPAGSLPACDRELSYLLGFGTDLRRWKRLRDAGALHGWSLCSDGRLYHQTVAEKVFEALKAQSKRVAESERLRKYREQKRQEGENVHVREQYANSTRTHDSTSTETVQKPYSTGRSDQTGSDQNVGEEKERRKGAPQARLPAAKPVKPGPPPEPPGFSTLWEIYPAGKRGNRAAAAELYRRATCPPSTAADARRPYVPPVDPKTVLDGAQKWHDNKWRGMTAEDYKFQVGLERWLTDRKWEDAPEPRRGKLVAELPSPANHANLGDLIRTVELK